MIASVLRIIKFCWLINWSPVTHIYVSELTIIAIDNGFSPGRRQVIIWTNARILLIRTSRTKFSEILYKIHAFSFMKMHLEILSENEKKTGNEKWLYTYQKVLRASRKLKYFFYEWKEIPSSHNHLDD